MCNLGGWTPLLTLHRVGPIKLTFQPAKSIYYSILCSPVHIARRYLGGFLIVTKFIWGALNPKPPNTPMLLTKDKYCTWSMDGLTLESCTQAVEGSWVFSGTTTPGQACNISRETSAQSMFQYSVRVQVLGKQMEQGKCADTCILCRRERGREDVLYAFSSYRTVKENSEQ